MKDYNLFPIDKDLDTIAYTLFRAWTAEALKHNYGVEIKIVDEGLLVQDLRDSMLSALEAIHTEKISHNNGWKIGYFYGFTQSNLNCHWCHEYIQKQRDAYRSIVLLQEVNKYFLRNREIAYEIEKEFQVAIDSACNFQIANTQILATVPAVELQMDSPITAKLQSCLDSDLFTCFNNIISERILELTTSTNGEYLPDLESFIEVGTVEQIIESNIDGTE